ncbi:hypothetical protein [Alkalibacillus flavidus]|uniref:hypothetical protein n=1 Tax=Alkalibacillus flavidus TaxID=546021 RepID=UPI00366BBC44
MRWYHNSEIHRFDQPIGKQYSYGHGPEFKSEDERKNRQIDHLKAENDILKKYMEIKKEENYLEENNINNNFSVIHYY